MKINLIKYAMPYKKKIYNNNLESKDQLISNERGEAVNCDLVKTCYPCGTGLKIISEGRESSELPSCTAGNNRTG